MSDNIRVTDANGDTQRVATDEASTLNGVALADAVQVQRVRPTFGADGTATDVRDESGFRFPVADASSAAGLASLLTAVNGGTFGYTAGSAPASVDLTAGVKIREVSLVADISGDATVAILGGATITVPAGSPLTITPRGRALADGTADVVIGGNVSQYYVEWEA